MSIIIIHCTCPNIVTAEQISRLLVSQKLAACVNQVPNVTSVYEWQGKIKQDNEVLLLIKTETKKFTAVSEAIREVHPYELPELIAVSVTQGEPNYLEWIKQCTK